MNKPKLKPCPFCGSDIVNIDLLWGLDSDATGAASRDDFQAACRNCGGRAACATSRADAALYWNRRASAILAPIEAPSKCDICPFGSMLKEYAEDDEESAPVEPKYTCAYCGKTTDTPHTHAWEKCSPAKPGPFAKERKEGK